MLHKLYNIKRCMDLVTVQSGMPPDQPAPRSFERKYYGITFRANYIFDGYRDVYTDVHAVLTYEGGRTNTYSLYDADGFNQWSYLLNVESWKATKILGAYLNMIEYNVSETRLIVNMRVRYAFQSDCGNGLGLCNGKYVQFCMIFGTTDPNFLPLNRTIHDVVIHSEYSCDSGGNIYRNVTASIRDRPDVVNTYDLTCSDGFDQWVYLLDDTEWKKINPGSEYLNSFEYEIDEDILRIYIDVNHVYQSVDNLRSASDDDGSKSRYFILQFLLQNKPSKP